MSENGKKIKINNLILGGGISGIFLGLEFLQRSSLNFLILEKEDRLGGLCRSFKMGGLYYDIGAHALHKKAVESSNGLSRFIDINKLRGRGVFELNLSYFKQKIFHLEIVVFLGLNFGFTN